MTIERTLMHIIHIGAQDLSHGRSIASTVLSRFIQGMPYAFDIMDQLKQFASFRWSSSDQHVELTLACIKWIMTTIYFC